MLVSQNTVWIVPIYRSTHTHTHTHRTRTHVLIDFWTILTSSIRSRSCSRSCRFRLWNMNIVDGETSEVSRTACSPFATATSVILFIVLISTSMRKTTSILICDLARALLFHHVLFQSTDKSYDQMWKKRERKKLCIFSSIIFQHLVQMENGSWKYS